ncbi:hypothetical protein ORV05_22600 [Amycolatopsis cynarae]|uniref:FAD-binding domain-containing protein n=1 Tax=Amycolatopsis cynarae TaxID=2995223 RepID=A0ABY7BF55_9PSEU|nr:hypothetical protein [Amycolatopsis sp. HUAS 11-8]WAL69778.1 hypothetical protein ORV05_22600 [Amycolatopsis sp. HUAS 11-8]
MLAGKLRLAGVRLLVLERQPRLRETPKTSGFSGQILELHSAPRSAADTRWPGSVMTSRGGRGCARPRWAVSGDRLIRRRV